MASEVKKCKQQMKEVEKFEATQKHKQQVKAINTAYKNNQQLQNKKQNKKPYSNAGSVSLPSEQVRSIASMPVR